MSVFHQDIEINMSRTLVVKPENFATFGELLKYLRRKAGLTQRELAIAVGYSESQISRLEKNERAPDDATLAARFLPALYIEEQPEWAAKFLDLGAATHSSSRQNDLQIVADEIKPANHNLPIRLTSFIGREKEIKEIKRVFTSSAAEENRVRLLTLSGHGGCGKTRLAIHAASSMLDHFLDGIWLAEFGPLADPDHLTNTLAAVLGVAEEPNGDLITAIANYLRGKTLLLIFDNCEHLIQASAELAESLLQACPTVYILATSRELLGVNGERAMYVPSLSMPDRRHPPQPGQFAQFESIQLFVDRAANLIPEFTLNKENESAIAQICERLDGIPLAIELAAARLRMLPVEQIATRLDDVFRLLTGGSRTALPRHQTLQALIDWSYDLLTESEKALFRRLTVFARHWTIEACEAICAGDGVDSGEVFELLGRLIEKSLALKRSKVVDGVIRYRLLDSIRQYALVKLIESGEADAVRRKHAEYYFTFAEAGAPRKLDDYLQRKWLDNMELEIDNIRAALAWSISTMNNEAVEMRMDRKGGIRVSAWALNRLGWMARERGDTTTARGLLEQSLSIYRELDDKLGISWTTVTLGEVFNMLGDLKNAIPMLHEGLMLARQENEGQAIGWALSHLGYNALLQNKFDEAAKFYNESAAIFESIGLHKSGLAWAYFGLAESALAQKDAAASIEHIKNAVKFFSGYKNRLGISWCLESLACMMSLKNKHESAAKFWGAAESLREEKAAREAPILHHVHEDLKIKSRTKLGQSKFKALSVENKVITLEQITEQVFAL